MLQPEDDAAWQLLAASGNERPRVVLQRRIFMLLLLMLLPVADQTALPIRRPRTKQLRGGQGERNHTSSGGPERPLVLIRPSPALETGNQSAGLRDKIDFRVSRVD
jgi:hypothetical protein